MSGTITFAIPFYQGKGYLAQAIESVLAQTSTNWKLVIVDDCGGEDLDDLKSKYCDDRIKFIHNSKNLGLAENWNKCVSEIDTELVTILHSDDVLKNQYIEQIDRLIGMYPNACAYHCGAEIINEDGKTIFSFRDQFKKIIRPRGKYIVTSGHKGLRSLLRGDWIFCPTLCYRQSLFNTNRFDSKFRFVTDLDLLTRILLSGETIIGTKEIGYQYRRHLESQTHLLTQNQDRFEEELQLMTSLAIRLKLLGWKKEKMHAQLALSIRLNLLWHAAERLCRFDISDALSLLKKSLQVISSDK